MDLSGYGLEDLFLTAMKAEADSKVKYSTLASRVKNAFLKDRLSFLASEEDKHWKLLDRAFRNNFPGKEPGLPEEGAVPLPEIDICDESAPISEVLQSAMEAEMAAKEFYHGFAARFDPGSDLSRTLEAFALMEEAHYRLLEVERDNSRRFEDYDDYWPMMHAGP